MSDTTTPMPVDHAAIVPLDYGRDRQELSLVYSSQDWSKLTELLRDPPGFFVSESVNWNQIHEIDEAPRDWKLLMPATVILQWAGKSRGGLARTASIAQSTADTQGDQAKSNAISALVGKFGSLDDVRGSLDECFPTGMFVAEFAFKTRSLFIRYHPPKVKEGACPRGDFSGSFTNATVNKMPIVTDDYHPASLHIDIGKTDDHRATFAVNYIQNCAAFFTQALKEAGEFFSGNVSMVPQQGSIDVKKIPDGDRPTVEMDDEMPFPSLIMEIPDPSEMTVAAAPAGDSGGIATANDSMGSGQTRQCLVCVFVNGQWIPSNPPVFAPDTTVVKCYT